MATVSGLPSERLRWMFSIGDGGVVHQQADRQRQPAQRHQVDRSARSANSPAMPAKIDSGIDTETISVLRQLPRNTRIISETRIDEIIASRTTLVIGRADEHRLVEVERQVEPLRRGGPDLRHQVAGGVHHRERGGVGVACSIAM